MTEATADWFEKVTKNKEVNLCCIKLQLEIQNKKVKRCQILKNSLAH
jgi:hypothetical protein